METEILVQLIKDAQQGNSEAMNTLFTEFYNDVYYFALKTVKDSDTACDITQETFVDVIRNIGSLQEPAAFPAWVKKIAYHQCTRYFSKHREVLVEEDEDGNSIFDTLADESEGSIPSQVLEQEEFRNTILSMINELTEEQRSAVLLYYFDELTVGQIAQIQGVSEGTVKSRLNYARKAIKKSVESYEKKHDVKLHSFALLPLLLLLLPKEKMPAGKETAVRENVFSASSASSAAAATTTITNTASQAAGATGGLLMKLSTLPIWAKIVACAVVLALTTTAVVLATSGSSTEEAPSAPTVSTEATIPTDPTPDETVPEETIPEETVPEEIVPAGEKYESPHMVPYRDTASVKDTFVQFLDYTLSSFLDTEGKAYSLDPVESRYGLESALNIRSIANDTTFIYNDDRGNTFILCGGSAHPVTDIKGEPFWAFTDSFSGRLCVCSIDENGNLFYNSFNRTGTKEKDNLTLCFEDYDSDETISQVDSLTSITREGYTYILARRGDNEYCFRVSGMTSIGGETRLTTWSNFTGKVGDILDYGYNGAGSPLYKKDGDNTSLYYIASAWSSDELPISMPEGKTVDQLTRVIFDSKFYLFFDDGSVYYGNLTGTIVAPQLFLDDALTAINQTGGIKEIYLNGDLRLLMDDNVTYTYVSRPSIDE